MKIIFLTLCLFLTPVLTIAQNWQANNVTRYFGIDPVVIGDCDNDGDIDLVSVESGSNKIFCLENGGNGIFPELPVYSYQLINAYPGSSFYSLDYGLGDLDADGLKDLILYYNCNDDSLRMVWLKNVGNLNFGSPIVLHTSKSLQSNIELADFDGDGDNDIILINELIVGEIEIIHFLNDGNGIFSANLIANNLTDNFVVTNDKDNDGDLDLIFSLNWFENIAGSFTMQNFSYFVGPVEIFNYVGNALIDDFNGDGFNDIVYPYQYLDLNLIFTAGNINGDYITIFNDTSVVLAGGIEFDQYRKIDFEGDGDMDIVVYRSINGETSMGWFENNGAGHFGVFQETYYLFYDDLSGANNFLVADITGDGNEDILVNSTGEMKLSYLKNLTNGNFSKHKCITLYDDPVRVNSADFNSDGKVEILTTSYENLTSSVYFQFDNGKFHEQQLIFPLLYEQQYSYLCDHLDFDNDGDEDFLGGYKGGAYESNLAFYENENGIFENYILVDDSLDHIDQMMIFDFNNDGFLDILVVTNSLPISFENSVLLFQNNQIGGFVKDTLLFHSDFSGINLSWFLDVACADFDGDGYTDFIVADAYKHDLYWYKNNGSNSFFAQLINVPASIDFYPKAITAGDIDNNNSMDVCVSYAMSVQSPSPIFNLYNNGTGAFSSQLLTSNGDGFGLPVYIEDFNNDGFNDILASQFSTGGFFSGDLRWFVNSGTNNFAVTEVVSDRSTSFYSIDYIDNDNLIDVLAINCGDVSLQYVVPVLWYKNPGLTLSTNPSSLINAEDGLAIYPNPAKTNFVIEIELFDNFLTYQLIQIDGTIVAEGQLDNKVNNIDISSLASGTYIVVVFENNNIIRRQKLIAWH